MQHAKDGKIMNGITTTFLEELKDALRSKKIIFVILITLFICLTLYASGFMQMVYLLFFKPQKFIPFPISITYYLLFFLIPTLAVLLGHDMISAEVENSTLRGVLSKIKRRDYLLAKLLALVAILATLSLLLLLTSSIYTYIRFNQLDLFHPLIFFFYLILYIIAYSSMVLFLSSIVKKSSTSLLLMALVNIILIYISMSSFSYLSLFSFVTDVMSFDLFVPVVVYLAYTTIFTVSSFLLFEVRDV
jgi:ABC-type transport system involved in multi-copper enzyme maturation permease subunit